MSILTYEGQSCPEKYSIGGQQCGEQELGFVEETQEEYAGNLKYICVFPPPPLFFSFFLFFFFFFFWPCTWDLSFPTRDQTYGTCTGRQIFNHWTTREVPPPLLLVERIGEGVLSEITKTSKVGNIAGRDHSLLLFSAPFSNRENFSRGHFGSDHQ